MKYIFLALCLVFLIGCVPNTAIQTTEDRGINMQIKEAGLS